MIMLVIYIIMNLVEIFQCSRIIHSFHWQMAEPKKILNILLYMASILLKSILQDVAIKNKELVQNDTIVF